MVGPARPQFVLFGSSIVQLSFSNGGWGAILSDIYARKVYLSILIISFFVFFVITLLQKWRINYNYATRDLCDRQIFCCEVTTGGIHDAHLRFSIKSFPRYYIYIYIYRIFGWIWKCFCRKHVEANFKNFSNWKIIFRKKIIPSKCNLSSFQPQKMLVNMFHSNIAMYRKWRLFVMLYWWSFYCIVKLGGLHNWG